MRIARVGRCFVRLIVVPLVAAGLTEQLPAAPEAVRPPETVALSLRLPITGTRDERVRGAILRQLDRLERQLPERGLLVLRFDVEAADAAASDFGRSLD
ncbi:MAG: hypothetical protein ACKO1M_12920, partial [Planctomycetota bacterium]